MDSKYFNKDGHFNDEGTALIVDAMKLEKTDLLPQNIKDHIEACEPCHQTVIDLYSAISDLDYTDQGFHRVLDAPVQKATVRRLIYRIVAAAVLAGFAFYFFSQYSNQQTPKDNNLAQKDTVNTIESTPFADIPKDETKIDEIENYKVPENNSKEASKAREDILKPVEQNNRQLFAMNYTPNAEFENFVGEVYRSSKFQLEKPENETTFKEEDSIPFSWNDPDNKEWSIFIFNNKGEEIHNAKTSLEKYFVMEYFPPGLYYWRLETIDDLLHVGKFFIE